MSDLEKYLEFVNDEIDVELLCLYTLGKIKNPEVKEMIESDLEKFKELKSKVDEEMGVINNG